MNKWLDSNAQYPDWARSKDRKKMITFVAPRQVANTKDLVVCLQSLVAVTPIKMDEPGIRAAFDAFRSDADHCNKIDHQSNPSSVRRSLSLLPVSPSPFYLADCQILDEDKHASRMEDIMKTVTVPVALRGLMNGGLHSVDSIMAYGGAQAVIPTRPGVYSWTSYDATLLKPGQLAVSSTHLEAGCQPSLSMRLPGHNDTGSCNCPIWTVLDDEQANVDLYKEIYNVVAGRAPSPYGQTGVVSLPLHHFTSAGVKFLVIRQRIGDLVMLHPRAQHQVTTPAGTVKIARNAMIPQSIDWLILWHGLWKLNSFLISADDVVYGTWTCVSFVRRVFHRYEIFLL